MTTVFESNTYYTADELGIIIENMHTQLGMAVMTGSIGNAVKLRQLETTRAIMATSQRHNVPLNLQGYTSPENGCHICNKPMHYSELDLCVELGLPPDAHAACQHSDCPTCEGVGDVPKGGRRLLSRDWLDAPEYAVRCCEDCGGVGDMDSYLRLKGLE